MDEALVKRILPSNLEAEQSVIGSMIMNQDAIVDVAEYVTKDDFYYKQYALMYEAIIELYNEGKPVDLVTLQNRLREKDAPPEISDLSFVGELVAAVPTSRHAKTYAKIVADKAVLRRLIRVTEEIANNCYTEKEPLDIILQDTEKKIFSMVQNKTDNNFVPIQSIVVNVLEKIEQAAKTKGNVTGVSTGFTDLDYKTSGFQPSDLILIAARPSMGKTAFALNIAQYVATRGAGTTAIFSLEMSKEQLVNRLVAMESHVSSQDMRTGQLSENDWEALIDGAGVIGNSKLIIDDTPSISINELRSKCRKYKLEQDLKLIMIDYLQLMSAGGGKSGENRQQEISDISRALKALARELNVPVVALSQLSRAVEKRDDKRPMLSDLRESGAIEQDADVVMFIYRDDYYNRDSEVTNTAEIIIAKQRNGPTGTVNLRWVPQYTQFRNISRSEQQ